MSSESQSLVDHIRAVFSKSKQIKPEFTFAHLLQEVGGISPEELAVALAQLTTTHFLEKIIRVESPQTHGGIRDFHSFSEVPQEIRDWRTNKMIDVRPENLVVIFRPGPEALRHVK